jgi:hypothetical protein
MNGSAQHYRVEFQLGPVNCGDSALVSGSTTARAAPWQPPIPSDGKLARGRVLASGGLGKCKLCPNLDPAILDDAGELGPGGHDERGLRGDGEADAAAAHRQRVEQRIERGELDRQAPGRRVEARRHAPRQRARPDVDERRGAARRLGDADPARRARAVQP